MKAVRLQALQRGPPSSRLCRLWSRKEDLQGAWNRDRKAVWDQVGLSHCQFDGLVTVRDEALLRWGHNDQSRQGHQCSKTTLIGETQFHISTPLGIEPRSLMMGSKWVDHWTSGTVYECSEIKETCNEETLTNGPAVQQDFLLYCFPMVTFYEDGKLLLFNFPEPNGYIYTVL
jgi:hypothetical protein